MKINFKCKKCKKIFDCEVGEIRLDEKTMRSNFTNEIICPKCGKRKINGVILTELGQSQLTKATFGI